MKKLIPALFVLFFLACADDKIQVDSSYDFSSKNIVTFKDGKSLDPASLVDAEKAGFKSMDAIYKDALTKISLVSTDSENQSLLKQFSAVLTLRDSTYVPLISNLKYRRICNVDRLYVSGDMVHKVVDDSYIVFTEKANISQLRGIESIVGIDTKKFRVAQYQGFSEESINGRTKTTCPAGELRADYFDNHTKCKDDRRAWVRAYPYFEISGYYYTPYVISECWAEIRNGLCNWNQYQNTLYSQNCSFTTRAALNDTYYYASKNSSDMPNYAGTSYEWEHVIWGANQTGAPVATAIYWQGGTPPTIQFSAIHMESSSQGVGANDPSHYAVLDCN